MKRSLSIVVALLALALSGRPAMAGLDIVLYDISTPPMTAAQLAAFNVAAQIWEARIDDPITVTIDVEFSSSLPNGALGGTRTMLTTTSLNAVQTCLLALYDTGLEQSVDAMLPNGTITVDDLQPGTRTDDKVTLSRANARALMLDDTIDPAYGAPLPNNADAHIIFSTSAAFDYDRSNGISAGQRDFVSVAAHEIGHALGFFSVTDTQDINPAFTLHLNTLDLYRFSDTNGSHLLASETRKITKGPAEFYDTVLNNVKLSRGDIVDPNCLTGSQKCQASHWQDGGTKLMDPTLSTGISIDPDVDTLHAFDYIGYSRNPAFLKKPPVDGTVAVAYANPGVPPYSTLASQYSGVFTANRGLDVVLNTDYPALRRRAAVGIARFAAAEAYSAPGLTSEPYETDEQNLFPPRPPTTALPDRLTNLLFISEPATTCGPELAFFDSFSDDGAAFDPSLGSYGGFNIAAFVDGTGDGVANDADALVTIRLLADSPAQDSFFLDPSATNVTAVMDPKAIGGPARLDRECPDRPAPPIVGPASPQSAKCLGVISKAATGFVKTKLSTAAKCSRNGDPTECPSAKTEARIEKAALKAIDRISSACGDDAVQAGLASSYGSTTDEAAIGSCMLSQHNATAAIMSGWIGGVPAPAADDDSATCVGALGKSGARFAVNVLQTINKCVNGELKAGNPGDLGPTCVGSWADGVYTPPTHTKTADKITKAMARAQSDIEAKCGSLSAASMELLLACPGATSIADLKNCVVCNDWTGVIDLLVQQYNESGSVVASGPGAIQTALNAASPGDKLLFASGIYEEELTITTDDLVAVGCGGASNERPVISPPSIGGPFAAGLTVTNADGVVVQGLKFQAWDEGGISVSGSNDVTLRDIVVDGQGNSEYGVSPASSTNVVVEGSVVTGVKKAGIYVTESSGTLVRFNRVEGNVGGVEIENSCGAQLYGNLAIANTGGLLVFKVPGLTQSSGEHEIHHNAVVNNNTVNFADAGTLVSLVPDGTGILVLSNDRALFHHNHVSGNDSLGFALYDQQAINALVEPDPFSPASPDQTARENEVYLNSFVQNGDNPDSTGDNATPVGGNGILSLVEDMSHANCFDGLGANTGGGQVFLTPNDCP